MVGDTKIMSPRNCAGTAEVGRSHTDQLIARTRTGPGRAHPVRHHRALAAGETPIEVLTGEYLPLLQTALHR